MVHRKLIFNVLTATVLSFAFMCSSPPPLTVQSSSTYEELITLFKEWREFHSPEMLDGVPDYSVRAMKKQHTDLENWQHRLNAFDTAKWPIKHH